MTAAKLIDYSFERPPIPADVVAVVRYGVGGTASKLITPAEVAALHHEGKAIVMAFESTAQRAAEGAIAGLADLDAMEKAMRTLGYPHQCPIFYAVDFDASPSDVLPYFHGIIPGAWYPSGPYAGIDVVEAVLHRHPRAVAWQTLAWSSGKVSKHKRCILYQNGVGNGYDTDITLQPFYAWGKDGPVLIGGKPQPAPKPPKKTNLSPRSAHAAHHLATALPRRKHGPTDKARAELEAAQKAIQGVLK